MKVKNKEKQKRVAKNWLISIFVIVLLTGIGVLIWGSTKKGSTQLCELLGCTGHTAEIQDTCIGTLTGFLLGLTFLLWYPISRLVAWSRTRTLKNQNLQMDLKIKEQHLSNLQSGVNLANNQLNPTETTKLE